MIKPLYPRVILKRLPPRLKTQLIALPDTRDNRFCEVVAVHDGRLNPDGTRSHKCEFSPGDIVQVYNFDAIEQEKFKEDGILYETVREDLCHTVVDPQLIEENRIE